MAIPSEGTPVPLPARQPNALLTIPEVIEELGVAKATYYRWRQLGKAPRSLRLPNGQVRVRRSVLDAWLEQLEEGEPDLAGMGHRR
jgi:predicted DNA-binding transcriptional regulator AlpA